MRRAVIYSLLSCSLVLAGTQDSGLVEDVTVSRLLIDIVAEEPDGRPLRGLVASDFSVTLDGKPWTVLSADDFCGSTSPRVPESPVVAADEPQTAPVRYVLYFDLSRLDGDGLLDARAWARDWVRRVLPAASPAQVVVHSGHRLEERCPFTTDREQLDAAIVGLFEDTGLGDAFASTRPNRIRDCARCFKECSHIMKVYGLGFGCDGACQGECELAAVDESRVQQDSIDAGQLLLARLERVPGRKRILWFDNATVNSPAHLYVMARDLSAGEFVQQAELLAARAVLARAEILPAFRNAWFENVADQAGTPYRFFGGKLPQNVDECVYRLAFKPLAPDGRTHRVRVKANGKLIAANLRVLSQTPRDRWREAVRSILASSKLEQRLPVATAIVPLGMTGGKWRIAIEVAPDLDALEWLPKGERLAADWAAGALLVRDDGRESWSFEKFLGAQVLPKPGSKRSHVLHRAELEVPPGSYTLSAYFGDTHEKLTGGARVSLRLPKPGEAGIAGPVLRASGRQHLVLDLPQDERQAWLVPDRRLEYGSEPARPAELTPGSVVEALAFVCPGDEREPGAFEHELVVDGRIRELTGAPAAEPGGDCVRLTTVFVVPPGASTLEYHVKPRGGSR